jgi:hypothetical protein
MACTQFRRIVGLIAVSFLTGLHPTTGSEQPSLWKGAVLWGTIADANLSLAATLLHCMCSAPTAGTCNGSTAAFEGQKDVHNWSCLKATMGFRIGNVRVDKQVHRNQLSFHLLYPAEEGISFPENFCTSLLDYTSSYPKFHINVSKYTDFYVFKKERINLVSWSRRVECDITRLEV